MRSITAAEVVEDGAVRDQQGRKRTSRSRREELVAAWKRSGLSQAEFARREGVRYPTFAGWVQRARLAARVIAGGAVHGVSLAGAGGGIGRVFVRATGSAFARRHDRARSRRGGGGRAGANTAAGLTMLAFPAAVRIFVAVQPVDMRKQFNGLWSVAAE